MYGIQYYVIGGRRESSSERLKCPSLWGPKKEVESALLASLWHGGRGEESAQLERG